MGIGRRALRIGLLVLVVAALGALSAARFFGPQILERAVVLEAKRRLGLDIRFGVLRLTFAPPRASVDDLEVADGREPLVTARHLRFDLATARSLWEGALIGDVAIDEPVLRTSDVIAFWKRFEPLLHKPPSGPADEESFRPRTLVVRSATIDLGWPRGELRAEIRGLSLEARFAGILHPRFEFETFAAVSAFRRSARVDLEKVSVQGKVSAHGFVLDSLLIDGQSGPLRASGALDDGRIRGQLDWRPILDPLFAMLPEAGVVRGGGSIAAKIGGTLDAPEVTADVRASDLQIHDVEFSGNGRLTSHGDAWKLDDANVAIFGGVAKGSAHGSLKPRVPFEAQAKFNGWQPSTFLRIFDVDLPLAGDWTGEARIAGDLAGDDLRGSGTFTLSEAGEQLGGTASFAVAKERAEAEGSLGSGPENQARARYRVIHGAEIAGDLDVKADRLAAFGPFVRLRIAGSGQAKARLLGTAAAPSFAGDVDLRDVEVLGVPLGAVRGPFEITRKGVASQRLLLADGEVTASGSFAVTKAQQNDWQASLQRFSLNRARPAVAAAGLAIPEISGTATGAVQASGPWSALHFRSQDQVADLVVAGEELGAGPIEVGRDADRWSASAALTRADGATIEVRGARGHDGTVSGKFAAKRFRLENIAVIHRELPTTRAACALEGEISGTESHPRGTATLTLGDLHIGDASLGNGDFHLTSDGAVLQVDGGAAGVRLAGSIAVGSPNAFRASFQWRDFDAGPFLSRSLDLRGVTSGEGELAGDRHQPLGRGSARITALTIGRASDRVDLASPVTVRVADGSVDVGEVVLAGAGQRIVAGGHWRADDASFQASLAGDLVLLESLSRDVASARGRVDARVDGSRHGDGPWHYHGRAELSGAAIDLALLVATTDLSAKLEIDDRVVAVRDLEGKIGGGDFRIAGSVVLDGDWNLEWAVRDASPGVPSWLDYRGGGHGKVRGPLARPLLEGEVEIDQAIYDRKIEWAEFLPWFRKQTRATPAAAALPLDVDLHVSADGGLFVDNNLANAEMRGDLRLRGGPKAIGIDGTIDVLSGEFSFRRRRFTITSGLVRFHDDRPANPDLSFSGETRVSTRDEEYAITVQVSGSADDPRIEFRSDDPSLTENDVLALVTFGRTVAQLQSQGAGIELGEALALTAGPRGEEVEKELHTLIPVDRIEIEPSFSRVSGSNEPRLSVAKDLTERFSAVIGSGLGNERTQDAALEYKLTKRFSLQGIWESATKNDAGAFGANFKFRAPFRGLPRFSLLPSGGGGR